MSLTKVTYSMIQGASVNVLDYGAVGDGVTDDTAAIQLAINACPPNSNLIWPYGTYLTTSSVNNFYSVNHFGDGIVKRSTNLYSPNPSRTYVNNIYVSTTGSDTNDGLSASQPFKTIQAAIDAVLAYKTISNPTVINVAAGTYNEIVSLPDYQIQTGLSFFTIRGATTATVVTTPTTILSGASLSSGYAIDCGFGNKVKVENILFTNWTTLTNCVTVQTGSYGWIYNCQSLDGTPRSLALIDRGGVGLVQGGGKDGGQIGIDCYSGSTLTLGYNATSTANGTFIKNTTLAGIYAKSHVHVVSNFCLYEDNSLAVLGYHNSRFDTKGDDFKRNTRVYRLQGSYVSENITPASTYNYGTADANLIVFELDQYSALDLYHASGRGGLDVCHQRQSTTITGTVGDTLARKLTTVDAYQLTTPSRYIEIQFFVGGTGAGTKTVTLYFGGVAFAEATLAGGTTFGIFNCQIWATNTTSAVAIRQVFGDLTLVGVSRSVPAINLTVDNDINVNFTVPGSGDTAVLNEARVIFWG
jgi:hypothetical protein